MPYPIVSESEAQKWYGTWRRQSAESQPFSRLDAPKGPSVQVVEEGENEDWESIADCVVTDLTDLLKKKGEADFESEGAVLIHSSLPDHIALRDPDFWVWFATVAGQELISLRYPFKVPDEELPPFEECDERQRKERLKAVPARDNFVGKGSRETLFFRLWIRAEMARVVNDESSGQYEFVYPGMIDFWRSHVFRQLFAHHRPFLHAFLDFQFTERNQDGGRYKPRLPTDPIRQLAKDLSKTCANLTVELLTEDDCRKLITSVWTRTEQQQAWISKKQKRAAE